MEVYMAKFRELSKESVKDREMKTSAYWKKIDLLHESVNAREGGKNYIFLMVHQLQMVNPVFIML